MCVRAGAGNQLTWLTMIALLLFVLDAEARSIPRPWPSNRKRSSTSKWAIGPCSSCCAYRSRCRQMQTICPRMIMWPPKNAEMHLHPGMVLATTCNRHPNTGAAVRHAKVCQLDNQIPQFYASRKHTCVFKGSPGLRTIVESIASRVAGHNRSAGSTAWKSSQRTKCEAIQGMRQLCMRATGKEGIVLARPVQMRTIIFCNSPPDKIGADRRC
jgi:hypothetical protein